ncbi:MAG TPA: metal ABC transporter substrate-binding protein [Candidatus Limnocylindrales bacterium]
MRARRPRGRAAIALAAALVMALAGCTRAGGNGTPGGSGGGGPVRVVTTISILADIVRHVGGDRVSVTSIVPAGVGPEDYEPRPDDARALASARLVVSNGVGLDDFLQRLLDAGSGGDAARAVLGQAIPTIDTDGRPNPHFWLDPTLVARYYVDTLVTALGQVDPAGAATYRANGAAFAAELARLDAELQAKVATIPPADRRLVTDHDAFPYFARHYGLTLEGVVLPNVGQDPTAADMAALVGRIRSLGIKAVFAESQFNPKLAQTLADEAGVKVVATLYSDTLGPPPADTYEGLLRYDVEQVVAGLTGTAS